MYRPRSPKIAEALRLISEENYTQLMAATSQGISPRGVSKACVKAGVKRKPRDKTNDIAAAAKEINEGLLTQTEAIRKYRVNYYDLLDVGVSGITKKGRENLLKNAAKTNSKYK